MDKPDDRLCVAVDRHIERVLAESDGCVSEAGAPARRAPAVAAALAV